MTHKVNFEIASERATIKEHMLLPPNDGQWKHPEHLNEHEMLQILQRESLNQNWSVVKKMLLEFPEGNQKWLRYNEDKNTWRQSRYNSQGCVNGDNATGPIE